MRTRHPIPLFALLAALLLLSMLSGCATPRQRYASAVYIYGPTQHALVLARQDRLLSDEQWAEVKQIDGAVNALLDVARDGAMKNDAATVGNALDAIEALLQRLQAIEAEARRK